MVIDAGGRNSGALRAALVLTDVLLVPFLPRSVDVWALADIAALVDDARSVRDGLAAYAGAQCGRSWHVERQCRRWGGPRRIPPTFVAGRTDQAAQGVRQRDGQGLSVDELVPLDPKASTELAALRSNVLSLADRVVINGG